FTHYLAPFPVQGTFQKTLDYMKSAGVDGVFIQGSGSTYSDMAELNTFVLAHLVWHTKQSEEALTDEFVQGYYGKAAPFIRDYLRMRRQALPQRLSALS